MQSFVMLDSLAGEPSLKHHAVLRVGVGQPGDAALTRRAGDHPPLPVDQKRRLGEPLAVVRLPARIIGDGTDDPDAEASSAVDQHVAVGTALVDQVLATPIVPNRTTVPA